MKIAIFKNMEFGFESVNSPDLEKANGYVRISEYVEVDFPPVSDDKVIQQQIEQLDALADRETENYRRKMAGIDERKSKLLAITHQP